MDSPISKNKKIAKVMAKYCDKNLPFLPIFYAPSFIYYRWEESEIKIINWIKKRYGFDADFNLQYQLMNVDACNNQFQMTYTSLCNSEIDFPIPDKQLLQALKKQMIIAKVTLGKLMKNSSQENMSEFKILLEMLRISGIHSWWARHSPGGNESFHEIRNSLGELLLGKVSLSLADNLKYVIDGLVIPVEKVAKPVKKRRGRKKETGKHDILYKLVSIYTAGTGKEPICYYHRINGHFSGDFYYFLFCALTILARKIDLPKIKPGSWGDYARDTIKEYNYYKSFVERKFVKVNNF